MAKTPPLDTKCSYCGHETDKLCSYVTLLTHGQRTRLCRPAILDEKHEEDCYKRFRTING